MASDPKGDLPVGEPETGLSLGMDLTGPLPAPLDGEQWLLKVKDRNYGLKWDVAMKDKVCEISADGTEGVRLRCEYSKTCVWAGQGLSVVLSGTIMGSLVVLSRTIRMWVQIGTVQSLTLTLTLTALPGVLTCSP